MILFVLLAALLPSPKSYVEAPGYFRNVSSLEERTLVTYVADIPEAGRHQDEAYSMTIDTCRVIITAVTPTGALRARQTLSQLVEASGIKCCTVTDWPAFPHRGFMQDCGRSYISVGELCTEIRALASMKMNVFHWHLTENQAWRLESRAYPKLNSAETMTRQRGKYYTGEDVRRVMALCDSLGVKLIPEIEVPGHSAAFTRCFGFDMQSPEGVPVVRTLLEEACELFRGCEYFHLGTDEVEITNPDFVPQMVALVRSRGFKVISWNPGFRYRPGEVDALQLWSYRGKAVPGIPAIDSKLHYLNHFDTFADIPILYGLKPCGVTESTDDFIGAEIAVWNDRYVADEKLIAAQNGLYAAAAVIAERCWTGGEPGDFAEFEDRFVTLKAKAFAGLPVPYVRQSQVRWGLSVPFYNGGDLSRAFPPEKTFAVSPSDIAGYAGGAGVYLRHVWGSICPQFFDDPQPNSTVYAWTEVWSPCSQKVGVLAEFQNYSRSEVDLAPPAGCWDWKGSKVWVNGTELPPPEWDEPAGKPTHETPLGNENLSARPPLPLTLDRGWNRVLLKLPVGEFSTGQLRLVKWMFNFIFVTSDGKSEAKGLIYSPQRNTIQNEIE